MQRISSMSCVYPERPAMTASIRRRSALVAGAAVAALAAAGVLTSVTEAGAATTYSFDTGSGLVFTVNGSNGNMTSLKHQGVELASSGQAAGQFESGWSSATVSSKTFDSGNSELITVANSSIGVTQYYFARKG